MGLLDIDVKKVITDEFLNNKKEWTKGWTGFGGGLKASKDRNSRFYYKKVRLYISIEIPSNTYPKESNVHKVQFGTIIFRYNLQSHNLRVYFLDYPSSILNIYSNNYELASYNRIIENTIETYKDYYVNDELDFDTIIEGIEITLNKYFETTEIAK